MDKKTIISVAVLILAGSAAWGQEPPQDLPQAQAVEFRGKDRMGKGTKSAYQLIRKRVPRLIEDRALYKDIEVVRAMINQAEF